MYLLGMFYSSSYLLRSFCIKLFDENNHCLSIIRHWIRNMIKMWKQPSPSKKLLFVHPTPFIVFSTWWVTLMTHFLLSTGRSLNCLLPEHSIMPQSLYNWNDYSFTLFAKAVLKTKTFLSKPSPLFLFTLIITSFRVVFVSSTTFYLGSRFKAKYNAVCGQINFPFFLNRQLFCLPWATIKCIWWNNHI